MAEREGFEPTVGISHDRFQDGSLKPLGHLSTCEYSAAEVGYAGGFAVQQELPTQYGLPASTVVSVER